MLNNKKILCILALMILLATTTVVSATEVSNDTTQTTNLNISSTNDITKDTSANKIIETTKNNKLSDNEAKVVTNSTFSQYFTNGTLNTNVSDGDTLDFQGKFIGNAYEMNINKAVNIITTTNDAYINLNTTSSGTGEDVGYMFQITNGGSYSNVTGITFYNSQIFVRNTTHVTLDNLTITVENQKVGSGVGHTSIRENSTYITLKNSKITTINNGAVSSVTLTWANYCTITNCTIETQGEVGNLIYINSYNLEIPDDVLYNSYNNITNNTIIGPTSSSGLCYALVVQGIGNLIDNNYIEYSGDGIRQPSGSGYTFDNNTISNNILVNGSSIGIIPNSTIFNNTVNGLIFVAENSTAYNNIADSMITYKDSNVYNNKINNTVAIASNTSTFKNNNALNVSVNGSNNIIDGNVLNYLAINSRATLNNVTNNYINSTEEYAIKVFGDNNTITNNKLSSTNGDGDDAVNSKTTTNTIENNTKYELELIITNETYSNYFDNDGYVINPLITEGSTVTLSGNFTDKVFVFNNYNLNIVGSNAILNGSTITATGDAVLNISNIIINNTGYNISNAIVLYTQNNIVNNITIYQNTTTNKVQSIMIYGDKNTVKNSKFIIAGPSNGVDWSSEPNLAPVIAITVESNDNNITSNSFEVYATTTTGSGTIEAICVSGDSNGTIVAENNIIANNTIIGIGTDYIYGIYLGSYANSNNVTDNNVTLNSTTYASAIQAMSCPVNNNLIDNNNINLIASTYAYGIVLGGYFGNVINDNVTNNVMTVTADEAFGIELYVYYGFLNNSLIENNTITTIGNYSMGIGVEGYNITIKNNTITANGTTNLTPESSYDQILPTTVGITIQNSIDNTIDSNNITVDNGPAITLDNTTFTESKNNKINTNNSVGINVIGGNNVTILTNTLNINSTQTILLNTTNDSIIKENELKTNESLLGDLSVALIDTSNIEVANNTPEVTDIIITDYNYLVFFDNDGYVINPLITEGSTVTLTGEFYNKSFVFNNYNLKLIGDETVLHGSTITATGDAVLNISDITINNTDYNITNAIVLYTENNIISNVTIYHNTTEGKVQSIMIYGDKNTVKDSKFIIAGPSDGVDWSSEPNLAPIIAITVESSNNNITNNSFEIYATTTTGSGTIEAICVSGDSNGTIVAENNIVAGNTILGVGTDYIYGIYLGSYANSNNVTDNNVTLNSTTYASAIQAMSCPVNNNIIDNNNLTLNAELYAYGIVLGGYFGDVINNNVTNNVMVVTADEAFGIELYVYYGFLNNSLIENNTITTIGNYSMGIGVEGYNITIRNNTITANGTTNLTPEQSYDQILPTTVGIIMQNSIDNRINLNTITMDNGPAITITETNNTIINTNTIETNNSVGMNIIGGNNLNITNNTLNINSTYTVLLNTTTDAIVKENELNTNESLLGDLSVALIDTSNMEVVNNTPEVTDVIITDYNYLVFFDNDGYVINSLITEGSTITLSGEFYNKSFVFNKYNLKLVGDETVLHGSTITVTGDAVLNISDITINNTDYNITNAIIIYTENNILDNITIYQNTTENNVHSIMIYGDKNTVKNSKFIIAGPSNSVDWSSEPNLAPVIAITVESSNNNITNNSFEIYATTSIGSGTVEAICVSGDSNGTIVAENNIISNNNIIGVGTDYIYGIYLGSYANSNNVTNNDVTLNSTIFASAIQAMACPVNNNMMDNNTLNLNAGLYAYGIVLGGYFGNVINNDVTNNVMVVTADEAFGIELYVYYGFLNNSLIENNTITTIGNYSMGIGVEGYNITIRNNTITASGTTNATPEQSYDQILPTTVGIIMQNSVDNTINLNTITVYHGPGITLTDTQLSTINNNTVRVNSTYAIKLNTSNNNNITDNYLLTNESLAGDLAVTQITSENNMVENNTPVLPNVNLNVSIPELEVNKESNITVTVTDDDGNLVEGTISLIINDELIQSITGSNITITFIPTSGGNKTITIVFVDSNQQYARTTSETQVEITKLNVTVTIEPVYAVVGDKVQFNTTITSDNTTVNDGKIIILIDDEELTDTEGKIITINVTNGTATLNYTATQNMLGNKTLIAKYYDSEAFNDANSTQSNILIENPTVNIKVLTNGLSVRAGKTINLVALITYNGKLVNNGIVTFKFNSVTLKDDEGFYIQVNVTNGIAKATYTIPVGYSAMDYTLNVVYGTNSQYNRTEANGTVTIVKTVTYIKLDTIEVANNTLKVIAGLYDIGTTELVNQTPIDAIIKINGVTQENTLQFVNGVLTTTITLGNYEVTNITICSNYTDSYYESKIDFVIYNEESSNKLSSNNNAINTIKKVIAKD